MNGVHPPILLPASGSGKSRSGRPPLPRVTLPEQGLPPCARLGSLKEARALFAQGELRSAYECASGALDVRPFHPEACVLLARIALAAGHGELAWRCALHASRLVPGFNSATEILNGNLSGNRNPDWIFLPPILERSPDGPGFRVSVCLIARNEERFLGQCLASIRDLAHQIIVVDTGSTDRTVEIARDHGALVHTFPWSDHFGAARNVSLEYATGDWVLILDADEELPSAQHPALRRMLEADSVLSWRLPIQDIGHESEGCSYVPRLFRNTPGAFFIGRVHEQAFASLEKVRRSWGLSSRLGEAILRHHGYTPEVTRSRDKVGRNLRLLEKTLREQPGDAALLMNYGLELTRSGQLDAALRQYRTAFAVLSEEPSTEVVPEVREMLLGQFTARLMSARRHAEVVEILDSPLAKNGGLTATLHFTLGLACIELRQFAEAARHMRECLAKRHLPTLAPVPPQVRGVAPTHCLARCLWETGDVAGADAEFITALQVAPDSLALRLDHARFLHATGRTLDALRDLHQVVARPEAPLGPWLAGGRIALCRAEFLEVALDWTAAALQRFPTDETLLEQRAEALLFAGRFAEALELWRGPATAGRPSAIAAVVLCESALERPDSAPAEPILPEVNREFVRWYRRLVEFGAEPVLRRLGDTVASLDRLLPEAARLVRAVTHAATEPGPAPAIAAA